MSAITANMHPYRPCSTPIHLLDRCAFIRRMSEVYDEGNGMSEPSRYMLPGDMSRIWRHKCNYGEHASLSIMVDGNTPSRPVSFHQTHVQGYDEGNGMSESSRYMLSGDMSRI